MSDEQKQILVTIKELLADPANRIKLDELVTQQVREFLLATNAERFPVQASNIQPQEFRERLIKYEAACSVLISVVALLARWGDGEHLILLEKVLKRAAEGAELEKSGVEMWLHLRWYPLHLLMYSSGISAIASNKYSALKIALETQVSFKGTQSALVLPSLAHMSDLAAQFNALPGVQDRYTPRSDYLFELFRPIMEELFFLGGGYEEAFNNFEAYIALAAANASPHNWAPMGRFGWNRNYTDETTALNRIISLGRNEGHNWPPLKAGLLAGSVEAFDKAATAAEERLIRMRWD